MENNNLKKNTRTELTNSLSSEERSCFRLCIHEFHQKFYRLEAVNATTTKSVIQVKTRYFTVTLRLGSVDKKRFEIHRLANFSNRCSNVVPTLDAFETLR